MNRLTPEARQMNSEPATAILMADCYGDAQDGQGKSRASYAYRRLRGIIFPDQLDAIANVEFLVETVDLIPHGIFWRSSPVGRSVNSDEQRAKGAPYYKR